MWIASQSGNDSYKDLAKFDYYFSESITLQRQALIKLGWPSSVATHPCNIRGCGLQGPNKPHTSSLPVVHHGGLAFGKY
jgi:hypothetical protein